MPEVRCQCPICGAQFGDLFWCLECGSVLDSACVLPDMACEELEDGELVLDPGVNAAADPVGNFVLGQTSIPVAPAHFLDDASPAFGSIQEMPTPLSLPTADSDDVYNWAFHAYASADETFGEGSPWLSDVQDMDDFQAGTLSPASSALLNLFPTPRPDFPLDIPPHISDAIEDDVYPAFPHNTNEHTASYKDIHDLAGPHLSWTADQLRSPLSPTAPNTTTTITTTTATATTTITTTTTTPLPHQSQIPPYPQPQTQPQSLPQSHNGPNRPLGPRGQQSQRLHAQGLCIWCRAPNPELGRMGCPACLRRRADSTAEWRRRRRGVGLGQ